MINFKPSSFVFAQVIRFNQINETYHNKVAGEPLALLDGSTTVSEEKITSSNAALFASIHFGSSLEPDTEPNIKF